MTLVIVTVWFAFPINIMDAFQKYFYNENTLRRSKSLCSLGEELNHKYLNKDRSEYYERARTGSESSAEVLVVNDTDSDYEGHCRPLAREPCSFDSEVLTTLESKIDHLSDMFLDQCRMLSEIKEEIQDSRETIEKSGFLQNQKFAEIVDKIVTQRSKELTKLELGNSREPDTNSRARSLLDAIEVKTAYPLDRELRDSLTAFLQSDEVRDRIVSASAGMVGEAVAGGVSALWLPALQRSQRRLARDATRALEDAFIELEEHWSQVSRQMARSSRSLRRALERRGRPPPPDPPQCLRDTVQGLLDKELKQWRQKVLDVITSELSLPAAPVPEFEDRAASPPLSLDYPLVSPSPTSPPQPADPDKSIIDQLMRCAEISKQIEEGDVNESFSRALSAADLSLVMAACRAAPPATVFAPPCRLQPPVLLALLQQLATDLLHETQLKCRYLEEALISLNPSNPVTRAHLPTVVGEVRRHLMKFLTSYPKHVARRRVMLIVMAADNLLNYCT